MLRVSDTLKLVTFMLLYFVLFVELQVVLNFHLPLWVRVIFALIMALFATASQFAPMGHNARCVWTAFIPWAMIQIIPAFVFEETLKSHLLLEITIAMSATVIVPMFIRRVANDKVALLSTWFSKYHVDSGGYVFVIPGFARLTKQNKYLIVNNNRCESILNLGNEGGANLTVVFEIIDTLAFESQNLHCPAKRSAFENFVLDCLVNIFGWRLTIWLQNIKHSPIPSTKNLLGKLNFLVKPYGLGNAQIYLRPSHMSDDEEDANAPIVPLETLITLINSYAKWRQARSPVAP